MVNLKPKFKKVIPVTMLLAATQRALDWAAMGL
ncbi:hypothetical protein BN2127_JRS10_03058 [Bacillus subtilis]|nr:hypothetical protein BN2127_JRS10_03058 [Bacillus subtilis]